MFPITGKYNGQMTANSDPAQFSNRRLRLFAWPVATATLAGAALFGLPLSGLDARALSFLKTSASLGLIWSIGWLLIRAVEFAERVVLSRFRMDVEDNLRARQINTQLGLIRKIIVFVIFLIIVASSLMVFDKVRQLGASLLTSAGIAGIIVGFAAQKTIAAVLAGLQAAITQPIRVDDVVVIDNEWGRIEEITLTYVVVKIWDERRLVVPIGRFIDQSFQNWTRQSAQLIGAVTVYVDYSLPLDLIREELDRILAGTDLWDGRVKSVQMTEATEKSAAVRILVSASNASRSWDLRCLVREKIVDFIRTAHPESLPRVRAELTGGPDRAES